MSTFIHPASLNAYQRFSQACAILRHTTRSSNGAWYQQALDLNLQLHIRTDGASITTFYYDRAKNHWSPGPLLTPDSLHSPEQIDLLVSEALGHARSNKASSLGVVLHIADEFATTELKPSFDNPDSLQEIRETAVNDPASILEDSSVDAESASWRVLPYPSAESRTIGTTVTLNKRYAPFFDAIRRASELANFPIISHALSAPLVAIMGLDQFLKPAQGKPYVVILQYARFSILACFNDRSDLQLVRTLQHRGLKRPANLYNSLATTHASLEFVDPDIFLVHLSNDPDRSLASDLQRTFPTSRVAEVEPSGNGTVPPWCGEPVASIAQPSLDALTVSSQTFTILRGEKWALQNFLPTPRAIAEVYPNKSEMHLLRGFRLIRTAIFSVAALCLVVFGLSIADMMRRPEWSFEPSQVQIVQARLARSSTERRKAEHWNNLLEDRSKAWASMEALSLMFPQDGGMMVKTYTHAVKAEATKGKAKAGFVKEWKITGLARDKALDYLNTLNTREGIAAHFNEVARVTGNAAFRQNIGNRNLVVNVRTQENSSFKATLSEDVSNSDESTYPFSFDLTITQRFEATDPLAINVTKE